MLPWKPGDELVFRDGDVFVLQQELGSGLTSVVYKAASKQTGQQAAVKLLLADPGSPLANYLLQEVDRLRQLRRITRHVPTVLATDLQSHPAAAFVTELAIGVELDATTWSAEDRKVLETDWNFQDALSLCIQLLEVTAAAHQCGFTMPDFKGANMFWERIKKVLTVTDWNTVGPDTPEGRARDVRRVGSILGNIFFGRLGYSSMTNLTVREIRRQAKSSVVSRVMQELILRFIDPLDGKIGESLPPRPGFASAQEALVELQRILQAREASERKNWDQTEEPFLARLAEEVFRDPHRTFGHLTNLLQNHFALHLGLERLRALAAELMWIEDPEQRLRMSWPEHPFGWLKERASALGNWDLFSSLGARDLQKHGHAASALNADVHVCQQVKEKGKVSENLLSHLPSTHYAALFQQLSFEGLIE